MYAEEYWMNGGILIDFQLDSFNWLQVIMIIAVFEGERVMVIEKVNKRSDGTMASWPKSRGD